MHKLEGLKDMLCDELEKYGSEKELTAGSLDVVDKLAHAIKNIDKILEEYDGGEYSGAYGRSYDRNRGGRSYAQRRDARGRYSSETMGGRSYEGGYSMAGDMAEDLRDMMRNAPDQQTRQDIQRIVSRLEQM